MLAVAILNFPRLLSKNAQYKLWDAVCQNCQASLLLYLHTAVASVRPRHCLVSDNN